MRALLALARFRVMRALAPVNRVVPEAVRRALALRGSAPASEVPRPRAGSSPRVLIAPTNTAGQGWQWARAIERELPEAFAAAMAFRAPGGFAFPVDQDVPLRYYRWSSAWARGQRDAVIADYTHLLLESGREPFGDASGRSVQSQIRDLTDAGVRVALVFHGSDIRQPSRHRVRVPHSPFRDRSWEVTGLYELRSRENRELVRRLGVPAFVTTPDLLHDLPDAGWLPVVVDPAPWREAGGAPPFARTGVPVVAHIPSVGRFKGSQFIDPVLLRLEQEGLIEYRRASRVPARDMPEFYGSADIVIDQVVMGIYGVAAIEAMCAGRLVLGHVSQHTRAVVRERAGWEVPVLDATPESLEATLRSVLADPVAHADTVELGRTFAAEVHGGAYAFRVLRDFLGG